MTWVLLSLMYSFSAQSAKIAAVLPPPAMMVTQSTAFENGASGQKNVPDVDFSLVVGGTAWKWDTFALFMLPGEQRTFKIASSDKEGGFDWSASEGAFGGGTEREKKYTAPANPGLYRLKISRGRYATKINVFVMIPFRGQQEINGYKIGACAKSSHFRNLSLPRGFIEANGSNLNTWLSPHFRLKEFVCHQPANFPKYLALREGVIRKLEYLILRVQRQGIRCPGLCLISGYRTPYFNACNGNVENSVHTYGGAADVYIDADNDGAMDDLNRDGRRDVKDAILLYNIADQLEKEMPEFRGGDGYYTGNGAHGAFIHTDIRGERSRWHQ
jgi:hypothetical protein